MDIADLAHNTKDGVHVAALAGAWIVLVTGFGGMRNRHGQLPSFAPRLPPALTRLTFTVYLRGRRLRVSVLPDRVSYLVDDDGPPLEIMHHGESLTVSGEPQERQIPVQPTQPRPSQPHGREPARRMPLRGQLADEPLPLADQGRTP
jgi:alpha,alpha-trehalose phosphorylase